MPHRLLTALLLVLALCLPQAPARAADDDGLKALDATQKKVVASFIQRQNGDGNSASAERAFVTADGRILLLWTSFFGNSQASALALLERGPKGWRQTGKAELRGTIQQIRLNGDEVRVDGLTTGPKDPRCCPTVKVVQRYSVARKLAPLR
jgi:hypothetical protein